MFTMPRFLTETFLYFLGNSKIIQCFYGKYSIQYNKIVCLQYYILYCNTVFVVICLRMSNKAQERLNCSLWRQDLNTAWSARHSDTHQKKKKRICGVYMLNKSAAKTRESQKILLMHM